MLMTSVPDLHSVCHWQWQWQLSGWGNLAQAAHLIRPGMSKDIDGGASGGGGVGCSEMRATRE